MRYTATYLVDHYCLADALRPDFTWGKQVKSVDLDKEYPDIEVIAAARRGAGRLLAAAPGSHRRGTSCA